MNLDHICIAVRDIDAAREKLCDILGYVSRTEKVTNTRQEVVVQFLKKTGSIDLKLIEPTGPTSPIVEFLRKGGGLHHICFKVEDIEYAVAELGERGARIISRPEPGEAFDENPIAFLYAGFGLNIEVIDTHIRRNEVD